MQGREDDAGDGQTERNAPDKAFAAEPADPLEKGNRNLGNLNGEVSRHMPGHQEEHCGRSEGNHHRVRQPPGLAKINQQVDNSKEITK